MLRLTPAVLAEPHQSHPEGPGAGRVPVFKQACAYKETELTCEATRRPTSSRIYNYPLKQPQTKAQTHVLARLSSLRTDILRQETKAERPSCGPGGPGPTRNIAPEQGSHVHGKGCGRRAQREGPCQELEAVLCTRNSPPKMLRKTRVSAEAAGPGGTRGSRPLPVPLLGRDAQLPVLCSDRQPWTRTLGRLHAEPKAAWGKRPHVPSPASQPRNR